MKLILLTFLLVMIAVASVVGARRQREQPGLSVPGLCALSGQRDGGSAFRTYQRTSAALPALSRLHRTLTAADPRRRVNGS